VTPIIFQPAKMLYTFNKNSVKSEVLIEKIDSVVRELKNDKNSVYYTALSYFFGSAQEKFKLPDWVWIVLLSVISLLIIFIFFNIFLRREVKRKTKTLKANEENLKITLESIGDGVIATDINGNITRMNRVAELLTGWSITDALNRQMNEVFKIVNANTRKEVFNPIKLVLNDRKRVGLANHTILISKDGKEYQIDDSAAPILNSAGKIQGVILVFSDITEKYTHQKKTAESERFFNSLLSNLKGMVYRCKNDEFRTTTYVNRESKELTGYDPQEFYEGGKVHYSDIIHEQDRNPVISEVENRLTAKKHFVMEYRIIDAAGNVKWVLEKGRGIYDENGKLLFLEGFITDITKRKLAEQALIDSEEKFRTLFEESNDAIYLMDGDTFIDCNDEAVRMFNCDSRDDMVNHKPMEFSPPVQPDGKLTNDSALAHINSALSGNPQRFYWKHRKKDGSLFDAEVSLNSLNLKGKTYLQAIVRDISFRVQADRELYKLSSIVKQSFEGISVADLEGNILFANSAWIQMHNYETEEELIGKSLEIFHNREQLEKDVIPFNQKVTENGFNTGEVGHIRKDGTPFHTLMNTTLLKDEYGKPYAIAGLAIDITDRKKAEEELKKHRDYLEESVKDRTSQLESFSYSVSHDLRAPVRHILGFSDIFEQEFLSMIPQKGHDLLNKIKYSANKMERLIDDLLNFSRTSRQELRKADIDFNKMVHTVISEIMQSASGRNIEWKISDLPVVFGDKNLLNIVWMNLIDNAVKYTGKKDKAIIEIGYNEENGEFEFYIKDNGVGFDMEYYHKLFGVFQRMHLEKDFPGTGIGLANVLRVISKHGGRTWAVGEVDNGAAFYFSLPKDTEKL
ncbi:MAG: PAS domain S-box protein, partial [Candidatus Delongbacteria bacterium]|nr:PAS domain S-box protein [Candidatus Delongbacteria bacterium]